MLLTHTKRCRKTNLERSSPRSLLATRMRRDYMGRRIWKKVEQNGETTLHERYLYRKTPGGREAVGRLRVKTPDGRWTRRDYLLAQYEHNSYCFAKNATTYMVYLQRRQHWLVEPPLREELRQRQQLLCGGWDWTSCSHDMGCIYNSEQYRR